MNCILKQKNDMLCKWTGSFWKFMYNQDSNNKLVFISFLNYESEVRK